MLSSLAAVLVLLLPLLWTLVHRARRAQAQRELFMQRALDASGEERKRIAGNLHDGVVQDLVAASFAVAAEAEQAATDGNHDRSARLSGTAATVRSAIGGLRSLLVDIYPPNLRSAGLAAALRDLVGTTNGRTISVYLDIEPGVAEGLAVDAQEAIFRVAQECLRNTVKHSGASSVCISLFGDGDVVRLQLVDDGRGFDLDRTLDQPAEGHLGLRLIADVAASAGARLDVLTRPGDGTTIRMEVPGR
jgi:two-component system NarL family sensor kinase